MNRDDIIRMAREAWDQDTDFWLTHEQVFLARFAALAAAAEREACAKVCETEGQRIDASWQSCATAIRARNDE